jgi:hypothetical protein
VASFPSHESFIKRRDQLMPSYGRLIFSDGCLREKTTSDCREAILALQKNGELQSGLRAEFNALFESDEMVQIQVDRFVALLESVKDDLLRMFEKKHLQLGKSNGRLIPKSNREDFRVMKISHAFALVGPK